MEDVGHIRTTASLIEALADYPAESERRKAFDEAIWAARGREAAILVTDLSGFTRLTKKHGILHFLAVFARCEKTCMPVVHDFGGELMKHEADDLICIFDDGIQAIGAALGMLKACADLNASLDEDDHVNLCVGVEHGRLLRLDDDAFGDPVNVAFKLGEDIAEPGEILVGPTAYELARSKDFDFSNVAIDGPRSVEAGKVALEHFSMRISA